MEQENEDIFSCTYITFCITYFANKALGLGILWYIV